MLSDRCDDLLRAVSERDAAAFDAALDEAVAELPRSGPAELTAAAGRLAGPLASLPLGIGNGLADLAGAMVEHGAEPSQVVERLARRVVEALELAAHLPDLWRATGKPELPDADDPTAFASTIKRLVARPRWRWTRLSGRVATTAGRPSESEEGLPSDRVRDIVEAWFVVGDWARPMLGLLQRKDIRRPLPHRQQLLAAASRTSDDLAVAGWLVGLLQVLDAEPLLVLHRPSGSGYRLTMSGIGDNFQLHTLLAATLVGNPTDGLVDGTPPDAASVAAATTGEILPSAHLRGVFNLVDGYGEWIWNEGVPADIPIFDGERVIVLDPPPYTRTWNAGRSYPRMVPSLTLDQMLDQDEAQAWLDKVAPAVTKGI